MAIATTLEERRAIAETVRKLMADENGEKRVRAVMETQDGIDRPLWSRLAEMGIAGLLVPSRFGGAGLGPVELELIAEETGAALACTPFLSSSVLTAGLLVASQDEAACARLLPGIAAGTTIATAALTAERGSWKPEDVAVAAQETDGAAVLTGTASYVTHAGSADVLLVVATTPDGPALFEVAPRNPGITIAALPTFDRTLRLDRITFNRVPATRIGKAGWPAMEAALRLTLVARAGEQAGGARRIFDMTVEYARTRIQFGRPIGGFQAIKHMAAELLLEAESATSAARDAALQLALEEAGAGEAIDLAAFACADAFAKIAATAIQMHGGIAFTWEHPAHLYLRRARAYSYLFGSSDLYRERFLTKISAQPHNVSAAP
ncbi:acyl-CoA dehydrogenase [Vineibacter terrae]|uniref:Acyl-CoA dehydrogenase n=1 Tax=Vineibacter terrae TaxID=2586908 RepID=A0A5C8PN16_9HYPH|nr:acyl-CoA dehydrogenase family protein [Vineibacter terrae]TXL75962.1 acyl-CoA dehydrogenase [Vineibacter terrae]